MTSTPHPPKLAIGARAPDFTLPATDGREYSLSGLLEGWRAVVLIFSCNHCPYVVAYEDRFNELQTDYEGRGVTLAAVNSNSEAVKPADSFAKMVERAKAKGFRFPYLRDATQQVARAYGAEFTPEVYLIDGERRLRYRGRIDDHPQDPAAVTRRDLRDALEALLEGRAIAVTTTVAVGCTIKWR